LAEQSRIGAPLRLSNPALENMRKWRISGFENYLGFRSAKELREGADAAPVVQPEDGESLMFHMREPDPKELFGVGR
jgi:hypothetical protein